MKIKWVSAIVVAVLWLGAASAASADIKMKTKMTVAGHSSEGTIYIKGSRQRSSQSFGQGFEMVSITQCDLKQTVQINDNAKTYMIMPMGETDSATGEPAPKQKPPAERQPTTTRRGGVVTYTSTITDTGERKKMFGFTARHLKASMTAESSPDACNPTKVRIESDGWYIDFEVAFNCGFDRPPTAPTAGRYKPECQDEVHFKRVGSAKLGYPVLVTTTIYTDNGQTTSTTTEVVELDSATLDQSLFEVPPGYTEAKSYQELMGMPSVDAIIKGQGRQNEQQAVRTTREIGAKRAGAIRVGVVAISNKTDRSPSLESLRNRIINGITESDVDAVPLDSRTPSDLDAEAKQKGCDYILYTDVAGLKTSGKVGGLLGRAAGVGGLKEKVEARLDYKLFPIGSASPQLTSSATAKEEGGDDASLSIAAGQEAKAVVSEVRKKR
jgi:hypothetical protein